MSTLKQLKDLNSKRREVLAKCLGARSSEHLSVLLGRKVEESMIPKKDNPSKKSEISTNRISKSEFADCGNEAKKKHKSCSSSSSSSSKKGDILRKSNISTTQDAFIVAKRSMDNIVDGPIPAAKRAKARAEKSGELDDEVESFDDYFQALKDDEEKVYKSSISFLKGTQSANPHNDYSQHFVDTGQRPQNFIRDIGLNERFDEYPKLKELIKLKDKLVSDTAAPPMYLKTDLKNWQPQDELGSRFDVILVEPPLQEYFLHTAGASPLDQQAWTWDQIEQLDVGSLADSRCFLWLWCGSSPEGLDRGRQCFKKWGFRRCEDICWVKRNCLTTSQGNKRPPDPSSLFQRTKEHCLMGIKGTVRRSTDGDFIHANVDIDLIITEESSDRSSDGNPSALPFAKPTEIFLLAEHFCLGRRRIHLFGRDDTIRPGWVTAGPCLTSSNFDPKKYRRFFARENGGLTTGCTDRVENLRPKSPPSSAASNSVGGTSDGQKLTSSKSSSSLGKNVHNFPPRKMMRR